MDRGTYALILELDVDTTISVGKLGLFKFPEGYYIYIGSALGGLTSRVNRHLSPLKRIHWHVDYLLQSARVVDIWSISNDERLECEWSKAARGLPMAQDIVPGFGSSDCRCPSHLVHLKTKPSFDMFRKELEERGLMCNGIQTI